MGLEPEGLEIGELDGKKVNKSIEILLNIFYDRLITGSLEAFIRLFSKPSKPYIKLHLIVDRQSLKLV